MKATIILIGNSRAIKIPKAVLEQCHIDKEAIMEIEKGAIIIKPAKKEARTGWDESFKEIRRFKEDNLLVSGNVDSDFKEWAW
ncbi:MAG: AbrB/MazE/SpoVT family DNA-binding domain-containing protein [Nitrospirota bacterium]|nr:AbrB/MazE/SpoVT family DNA-binding domain-containing protein [Nitrospirota bacterium]